MITKNEIRARAVDVSYGFKLQLQSVTVPFQKADPNSSVELPAATMTVSSSNNKDAQRLTFSFDLYQKLL